MNSVCSAAKRPSAAAAASSERASSRTASARARALPLALLLLLRALLLALALALLLPLLLEARGARVGQLLLLLAVAPRERVLELRRARVPRALRDDPRAVARAVESVGALGRAARGRWLEPHGRPRPCASVPLARVGRRRALALVDDATRLAAELGDARVRQARAVALDAAEATARRVDAALEHAAAARAARLEAPLERAPAAEARRGACAVRERAAALPADRAAGRRARLVRGHGA